MTRSMVTSTSTRRQSQHDAAPSPARAGAATLRRTRIVCISDTHNSTVNLPKGDVLIHAGDLTVQGTEPELARAVAWLEKADFACKIVIAGNHDVALDRQFYAQHGSKLHNQTPQSPDTCRALLELSPTITYLCHESATVRLADPRGPGTTFTVFGSPYSPQVGTWAFSYPPAASPAPAPASATLPGLATDLGRPAWDTLWAAIPTGTDIVVTHTPPLGLCDWSSTCGSNMGCKGLQQALARVRPRLAICGHVHEGRGATRVRWGGTPTEGYFANLQPWQDPGAGAPNNKKMSIVDLTARGGGQSLDNSRVLFPSVPEPNADAHAHTPSAVAAAAAAAATAAAYGGRHETCVINCSIAATNYPHVGGKKFNKPMVVDIDLPVWRQG